MELLKLAAGDVINVTMNGVQTFVPAAGVEIIILQQFAENSNFAGGIYDGTDYATNYSATSGNNTTPWQGNRLGITNTLYYQSNSTAASKGFSGIQIK
tara:strand:+ start:667 stop:960 length:294 start_codon:yes stop_codon:yes gene_type:complete